MIQTLYLLRHAKAEPWFPGVKDFERKLSQRGKNHMSRLSDWMKDKLAPPETALCSSSQRTRETLSPLLHAWTDLSEQTLYLEEIYDATAGALDALARRYFRDSSVILMVGHNPGFEYLALSVMRDHDAGEINKMATGTLAVIDFPAGYVPDSGNGTLRHWISRKNLGNL